MYSFANGRVTFDYQVHLKSSAVFSSSAPSLFIDLAVEEIPRGIHDARTQLATGEHLCDLEYLYECMEDAKSALERLIIVIAPCVMLSGSANYKVLL